MTQIHDILESEFSIIQAPMAGVQGSALAIAVSGAGGLGSLPCALLSLETLRSELRAIEASAAGPYNVNFFCHVPAAPDPVRERRWHAELRPYFDELGLDARDIATGPGRAPFSHQAADVLSEFRPTVVSFHFGLPEPALLARVRSTGTKVLSSATTVEEARWLEAQGVDAIIAQGLEAGGHRGMFLTDELTTQVATLALVPQVVKAVRVPVVAAGGIADREGVAAAIALGASAVQVGTSYLLCPEATTSAVHRAMLGHDDARHTAVTNVFTGRPARGIVNRAVRELGPISAHAPAFPLPTASMLPLRQRAEARGSPDFTPLWCGQNATGCRNAPAADITHELADGLARRR
jgi:nitronate monooxygenase